MDKAAGVAAEEVADKMTGLRHEKCGELASKLNLRNDARNCPESGFQNQSHTGDALLRAAGSHH